MPELFRSYGFIFISFESNQLGVYNHTDYRHFGISVRLVRDAN